MREIGSFIELQFDKGKEFYNEQSFGNENIIRLNTCRAALYHAVRCYGVNKVYIPLYECDTVSNFLKNKNIEVTTYRINNYFEPLLETNGKDTAIIIPNYYGIMSKKHFDDIIGKYSNVIIDNAQAFFFKPLDNCLNAYSCRKFVGVPDGSYVIGNNANKYSYEQDNSSDTVSFMLMRQEYGLKGKTYETRKQNEKRIDNSDIKEMSLLTRQILDGIDYQTIIKKRKENFCYARQLFDSINQLDIESLVDEDSVPMVYPLLIDKDVIDVLHENHIYQGHWWEYIVDITSDDMFENKLSRYITPITIDQRYSKEDIDYQYEIIKKELDK